MEYQISALSDNEFSYLTGLDDKSLARHGARRMQVDANPGFPCRLTLADAEIGESVLLVNYEHLSVDSPYRSAHAIFVREWAIQTNPGRNEVPEMLRHRMISVRAFDSSGMMVDADIVDGRQLESMIDRMLATESVSYLHLHNAKRGCYAARVDHA